MSKSKIDPEIQKLAEALAKGDRRKALSIVRSRLNKPFTCEFHQHVWSGWERGLNRQEVDSLIVDLLNDLPEKDLKKTFADLKKKRSEILIRDHTQKDLSKFYLDSWVDLLEAYVALKK